MPRRSASTTATLPAPSGRAVVRSLRGRAGGAPSVEFDARTVFDFIIGLSEDAGSTDDLPEEDRAWLSAARAGLRADVGENREFPIELMWSVGILAVERRDVRTSADLVRLVESASPVVVSRAAFCDELEDATMRPLVERCLAGDPGAVDELAPKLGDWHPAARIELLRRPEAFRSEALVVLRAWQARYAEIEDRVAAMITRDVQARAADAASLAPADLVEKVTGGVRWVGEPRVRRVILAPSYLARPYNYLLVGDDWRFFGYPIADEAMDRIDPAAPPVSLVRVYRAIGDETRLRILALLRERDWYLTELANKLELSKPTVKHHLALLRAAGLATVTEEGSLVYWSLRRNRLDEAHEELVRFVD